MRQVVKIWWVVIAVKLLLAKMPISYHKWRSFGIFRHGEMLDLTYATNVFFKHYDRVRKSINGGFTTLELGPGDSLASAVLSHAVGASSSVLLDVGKFAQTSDISFYNRLRSELLEKGFNAGVAPYQSIVDMLSKTNSSYLSNGLKDLKSLQSNSLSFVFSNAVLEHIRKSEFEIYVRELYRCHAPGSIGSHRVDLRDHLTGSLHSLRFSEKVWEEAFGYNSGFYTNRLRVNEIIDVFAKCGFDIILCESETWDSLPLAREALHKSFRNLDLNVLLVKGFDLIVRKN